MDTDPPPSYSSIVKDQLRRGDSVVSKSKQPDEPQTKDDNILQGEEDREINTNIVNSNPTNSRTDSTTQSGSVEQRTTGLWSRFKRGLEDLALFVIEILD